MKKLVLFFVFGLISLLGLNAIDLRFQETFLKANKEYKQGSFKEALSLYKRIPSKGARVYYNMGNAAYKQERYGHALLFWRRAERLWGIRDKSELFHNISLLKRNLFGKQPRHPFFEFLKTMRDHAVSFIRSAPLIGLQIFFLIVWFFLFFYIKQLYRKRYRFAIVVLFSVIALSGVVLITKYMYDARTYGVIVAKEASLISGPDSTFPLLGKVLEAQEVIIKKETGNYFKIKIGGFIGWVERKAIKKI